MWRALAVLLFATTMRAGTIASVDGTRIHYLERGSGAQAILFVPGWMMPADIWHEQLAYFGKTRRAIAIDPRSQGDSQKVADGNYPAMRARDLGAVIEALKLERVVLVAASSGVTDACAYIEQFGTDRIAGIVFVHGVPGADFDPKVAQGLFQWAQRFQTDRAKATEGLVRSLFVKPREEVVRALTAKALKMPTSMAIAAFVGAFTSDYRPALAKIDKPVLVLAGRSPWREQYEAMRDRVKDAKLETWDDAGHALYLEQPERFNARVEEFLKTLP